MNNYWNNNGKYQKLGDKLMELIPNVNEVENPEDNPKLERFRKLVNAYYDLYNNGGLNDENKKVSHYFPRAISFAENNEWDSCYEITEPIMDRAILEASEEQGVNDE
jgi:hypothetical protein